MTKIIAIQGYEGSFHQEAARCFFGKDVGVFPCSTFRETVKKASDKKHTNGGIIAIENSIAGSILPNYSLMQKSDLHITGEVFLHIKQQLMVNPEVEFEDIKEIHSHPMAFLQCVDYLEKHSWKLIETEDTALSAKLIHQHHNKYAAAIGSKLAAELFGLKIIAPNIHTMKNNYTRFLVLERKEDKEEIPGANKSSLYFQTDHSRGSLARVLTRIAEGGINLSKLQSFPIPGSDWKYSFHVDMEFRTVKQFKEVLRSIRAITESLRVYGIYKKGKTF